MAAVLPPSSRRVVLEVLGHLVSVDAPTVEYGRRVARDWSRCQPGRKSGPVETIVHPGLLPEDVWMHVVETNITLAAIRWLRGHCILLHAAGLADDQGRVLALVAPSGTGKTTASLALARRSLGYVTDETLAVLPSGRVLPYPKPLGIRLEGSGEGSKYFAGPDELGLAQPPNDLRLARIVMLHRVERPQRVTLDTLTHLDALVALIGESSSLPALSRPLQTLSELVDQVGGVARLTYHELGDAVEMLEGRLAQALSEQTQPRTTLSPAEGAWDVGDGPDPGDGMVRRRRVADSIVDGDEALVLVGDQPVRLTKLGVCIIRACETAATPADVAARAVAELGDHPQAYPIVVRTLASMRDAGLVSWTDG